MKGFSLLLPVVSVAVCLIALLLFPLSMAQASGPLFVRNTHPLFLISGAPVFEGATPEDSIGAYVNYSSTFISDKGPDGQVALIDLEAVVLDLSIRRVVAPGLEASALVPVIGYQSGVFDGLLSAYHSIMGLGGYDYGRSTRPDNKFAMYYSSMDEEIESRAGAFGLGDIRLGLKKSIIDKKLAVMLMADLPTGEEGYGGGEARGGGALLGQAAVVGAGDFFYNIGFISGGAEGDSDPVAYAGLGGGVMYDERTYIAVQAMLQSPPYDTGMEFMDGPSMVLTAGARRELAGGRVFELSFSEDPLEGGAPDFMMSAGYRIKY